MIFSPFLDPFSDPQLMEKLFVYSDDKIQIVFFVWSLLCQRSNSRMNIDFLAFDYQSKTQHGFSPTTIQPRDLRGLPTARQSLQFL